MRRAGAWLSGAALVLSGCSGGGGGTSSAIVAPTPTPSPTALYAVPAAEALSVADVQNVVAQAAAEARARSLPAVIAVTDRVGNVLAVFRMTGARATATTSPAPNGANIDAQNLTIPAEAGAIAKAVTGAYLSSGGNAFSSRTASQIVPAALPPCPRRRWPRKRPIVRRAVQPIALFGLGDALWPGRQRRTDRPQALAARPRR